MKPPYQPRAVYPIGEDSDCFTWATRSWSGTIDPNTGEVLIYELRVCRRTGDMRCSCMDAVCRLKVGNVLDMDSSYVCKHLRSLVKYHLKDIVRVR